jgi:U3 small nucleolar RNA-associated protein 5
MAAISGRVRPAPDSSVGRPAKRARHSHDAPANALSNILLNGHGTSTKLAAAYQRSYKNPKTARIDDSRAVISNGDTLMPDASEHEVVEISSESSSDSHAESDEEEEEEEEEEDEEAPPHINGVLHNEGDGSASASEDDEDVEELEPIMNGKRDPSIELGEDAPPEEPSFGEQLTADMTEPIDVEAALAIAVQGSVDLANNPGPRNLSAPSASSLGTVLTQALRTNDRDLLESCFEMNDLESVRSTIERLPSNLISDLLKRLAERIHKRPGRAGNLMVWVQWAIVSHGGYLAGQPDVVMQLGSLINVIRERANGLQPLLQLKGKLDMLSAQLELRRSMQGARDQNEDDEAVIYVEGEDESEEEEGGVADVEELILPMKSSRHTVKSRRKHERAAEVGADVSDDEEERHLEEEGMAKFFDEEAEESEDEEGLFDEDEDSEEEEDDEETSESGVGEEIESAESEIEEIPESEEELEQLPKASKAKLSRAR